MSGRVLIVGGGPAGLATAIACRLEGLPVTVLERRAPPPLDKPCGEGLMPDAVDCLVDLGVDPVRLPAAAFRGIRYLDGDTVAEGDFPGRPGLGVRRPVLHAALAARAAQLGADLRWGVAVRGLAPGGVATDRGPLAGAWVVGADGLHSAVRRWAGLAAPAAAGRRRFGVRRHYGIAPWTDRVEVWWADGIEAYVTPVGPSEVGVALLWSGGRGPAVRPAGGAAGAGGRGGGFEVLLAAFPGLAARLQGAAPASHAQGAGPLRQRCRAVTRAHVALVGDAGGYLDALTGEGLALTFRQALALAEALGVGHLPGYARRHAWIGLSPAILTHLLLAAEARPALRRRLVRTLAADRRLFSRLLAIHAGAEPMWRLGVGGALRLLGGLAGGG